MCSTGWRRPALRARWSTSITSANRSSGTCKRAGVRRSALGRARVAARHRRRRRQGAAATRRRAVLPHQCRYHLDRRGAPNLARLAEGFDPAAMDALLLLAPAIGSIGYGRTRRFRHGRGRALAVARRRRDRPLRLCRSRDPGAGSVQGRTAGRIFAHRAVHARRHCRPPARAAPRRAVDACGHPEAIAAAEAAIKAGAS